MEAFGIMFIGGLVVGGLAGVVIVIRLVLGSPGQVRAAEERAREAEAAGIKAEAARQVAVQAEVRRLQGGVGPV